MVGQQVSQVRLVGWLDVSMKHWCLYCLSTLTKNAIETLNHKVLFLLDLAVIWDTSKKNQVCCAFVRDTIIM